MNYDSASWLPICSNPNQGGNVAAYLKFNAKEDNEMNTAKKVITNFKAPVKINIELTGPSEGFCDIPLGIPELEKRIMPIDKLKKVLSDATANEIVMYSILLADYKDIIRAEVISEIELIHQTVSQIGVLKSLCFSILEVSGEDDLRKLHNEIKDFVVKYNRFIRTANRLVRFTIPSPGHKNKSRRKKYHCKNPSRSCIFRSNWTPIPV